MKHHCATSKEKHESVGLANICTSVDLTRRLFVFPRLYIACMKFVELGMESKVKFK